MLAPGMEPIDVAHETFVGLRGEIAAYADTIVTEADARLKVIDRIFLEVLGWPRREVLAENAVSGGFVDYSFSVSGRARLIVEAKRESVTFGLGARPAERGFRLNGPVFAGSPARGGIDQAVAYCGSKNAELACVTNGDEWIVFRGNRLGDGRDSLSGVVFVFSSLEAVEKHFSFFYALLSYEAAIHSSYRAHFQEAEGQPIRAVRFEKPLRSPASASLLAIGPLAADIERVMARFFDRLTGDDDPDLLASCFVETTESQTADRRLARVASDILGRLQDLDTSDPVALTALVRRAVQSRRHEFVIIVGTKGAGKSTFVTRFFRFVLPKPLAALCVVARVNLADSAGDGTTIVDWLDRRLLDEIEASLFEGTPPTYEELEGMFFDEYARLRRGAWQRLYETDHTQFQINFGEHIETIRRERPHDFISGLIRHIVRNRKKLPVMVFDNADHFDIAFQESVYQYARSIYQPNLCLVVLPVTDRTSWQLSRHGALQSFEHEALYLPTPATEAIIKKRIAYIEERVGRDRERPDDRYFISRGVSLSLDDLTAFTRSLQNVFLETEGIATAIGNLSNQDVRRALRLARNFATSPHLQVEDLLKVYLSGSATAVIPGRAYQALIKGRYDIYPSEHHEFVQNIFAMSGDIETSPLLGIRVLRLLHDAPVVEHEGALVEIDQVFDYCEGMGLEARATEAWLEALLKTGLCQNYDPTVTDIIHATRIEASPAGKQHLEWATNNVDYMSAMADVTPLKDEATRNALLQALGFAGGGWRAKTRLFIEYLQGEDARYCGLPSHVAYDGQREIGRQMERMVESRALVSRER